MYKLKNVMYMTISQTTHCVAVDGEMKVLFVTDFLVIVGDKFMNT